MFAYFFIKKTVEMYRKYSSLMEVARSIKLNFLSTIRKLFERRLFHILAPNSLYIKPQLQNAVFLRKTRMLDCV